ncbi:hypothetical protein [Lignipirellula cremea]|uniref:Uncharacterized protein n=1 Tax=Lignipirellula cremea TaxID=2528010 RepID=A0A518DWW5_9BACT|nr:hypothetical protein [Lignipirellula cremea]QDU96330.1 hypothetical protein Pla8534_41500 [Lignipirellula cremea]
MSAIAPAPLRRRPVRPQPHTEVVSLTLSNGLCRFAEVVTDSPANVAVLVGERFGFARGTELEISLRNGNHRATISDVIPWGKAYRLELDLQLLSL